VNVATQRTPSGAVQSASRVVTEAVSTGVQRILHSGSKVMRRGKNQDSDAAVQQGDESTMVQQDDASTTVNAQSSSVPDGGNSGNNAMQEYGVMDPDASMLSELGLRAPRFRSYTANEFSPIHNQVMSPTRSIVLSEANPSSPPRLNTSGNNEVMVTGMNLLDAQGAMDGGASVVGTHVPAPSPRQSTQSHVTHQLQQTLRNGASEQVCTYSPLSDNGNGASAFANWEANNSPTIVETVPEGNSDNDDQWPEGQWPEGDGLAEDLADDAQVDLSTRQSSAPTEAGEKYDSGLQELVIDTNDPGRADLVISVGALGNASGTPLGGSQNMSFGERAVDEGRVIDGNNDNEGMLVHSGSESSTSYNTPSGFDPSDPDVIADLMTRPPMADPCSPMTSTIRFNEQVTVAEYYPMVALVVELLLPRLGIWVEVPIALHRLYLEAMLFVNMPIPVVVQAPMVVRILVMAGTPMVRTEITAIKEELVATILMVQIQMETI